MFTNVSGGYVAHASGEAEIVRDETLPDVGYGPAVTVTVMVAV